MQEHDRPPVRVQDKRRVSRDGSTEPSRSAANDAAPGARDEPDAAAQTVETEAVEAETAGAEAVRAEAVEVQAVEVQAVEATDYLDDLRRLQADFENYRKRMLREQTAMAQRASARLVERLLPILDNLEAAVGHGEGGPGIDLVLKELKKTLAEEGLEEIPAEGAPFDPMLHEAFEAFESADVDVPTCVRVLRRGYRLKNNVIRPAMVAVARPAEHPAADEVAEG
jgi:molecular chaperone GrpE